MKSKNFFRKSKKKWLKPKWSNNKDNNYLIKDKLWRKKSKNKRETCSKRSRN